MFHVPSERLTGASTAVREPTPFVEAGCTTIFPEWKDGGMEEWKND
jgi:hypothetical protein